MTLKHSWLAGGLAFLAFGAIAGDFTLGSPAIEPGARLTSAKVFDGFGCTGKNVSPALQWHGAPEGTRSYALTVYDPDAPTGSGWWHWVVVNIPATVQELAEGAGASSGAGMPEGALQVRTDFGQPGFGGACPPIGDKPHRYIFTIHALKVPRIDLPPNATAALAGYMIHANELGQAGFTAYYSR